MIGSVFVVSRSVRRTRSFLLAVSVVLAAVLGWSAFAVAGEAFALSCTSGGNLPLPGSCFEAADGDQVDPDGLFGLNSQRIDWQTLVQDPLLKPGLVVSPDGTGNTDDVFGNNDRDQVPANWEKIAQSVPGKADFLGAWSFADTTTDDLFLYLAFKRAVDNGDVYYSFELNQSRESFTTSSGAVFPKRTDGDLMITYNISPSDDVSFGVCEWHGATPATSHLLGVWRTLAGDPIEQSQGTCPLLAATSAQGALNSVAIPGSQNYLEDNPATPGVDGPIIPVREFGEAAINLSEALEVANRPCFSFGRVWARTRVSESLSSPLQDFVAPKDIVAETCTARGVKYEDLNADGSRQLGEPGLENWRIWADFDADGRLDTAETPGNDADLDGHIDVAEPFDDTNASGEYSIGGIEPPTTYGYNSDTVADNLYVLREQRTPPATGTGGYTCSDPLPPDPGAATLANGTFPCGYGPIDADATPNVTGKDFGNYRKAKVIIKKVNLGGTQSDAFPFTTVGLGAGFSLAATDTDGHEIVDVEPNTKAGGATYSVTEGTGAPADKYTLTALDCDDSDSTQNADQATLDARTATIKVGSGETVTCTFTNTRKTGKLEVVKDLQPAGDGGLFNLQIDAVTQAPNVGDGGTTGEKTLTTGTHSVGETAGTSTSLSDYVSSIECRGANGTGSVVATASGSGPLDVNVTESSDIVCVITNKRKATVTIVKDAQPNHEQDFSYTTSLGAGFTLDDDSGATGASNTNENQKVFSGVSSFTNHTVTEGVVTGWTLDSINCNAAAEAQTSGQTVTIKVDPGDNITCTYVNRKDASVTIVKDADPADGTNFDYSGSFGAFMLDDGGPVDAVNTSETFEIPGTEVGSKTVTEAEEAGWTLADITCSDDAGLVKDLGG